MTDRAERSPGFKLAMTALIGLALAVPLLAVYALIYDRQSQSVTANAAITQGWGGAQLVAGPVVVIPYTAEDVETVTENGKQTTRAVRVARELFLSPLDSTAEARLAPETRKKSIYVSVLYSAAIRGKARFVLPADLKRFGIDRATLQLDRAEVRFGISDARGLQSGSIVRANGTMLEPQPGKGVAATGASGFYVFLPWDGAAPLAVDYSYTVNGSRSFAFVPRGGNTSWTVTSKWPSPSFGGNFLPAERRVAKDGFTARYAIPNLALGQALVLTEDPGAPRTDYDRTEGVLSPVVYASGEGTSATQSQTAAVGLIEPVDLYSQVNRAVKYGFLFIGFTFLAFLMFDVVGGARVAGAEYLMTGAGLVLFFVLLLAFAEVIGFTLAYLVAGGAIVGLLTAYSAAVLGSRRRAGFIAALLTALYGLLYVLLSLEAYSLLIGSVLLFVALATVMYATRKVDWSGGRRAATTQDAPAL